MNQSNSTFSSPLIIPTNRLSYDSCDNLTTQAVLSSSFTTDQSMKDDLQNQRMLFIRQLQERLDKSFKGMSIGDSNSQSELSPSYHRPRTNSNPYQRQNPHCPKLDTIIQSQSNEFIDKLLSESENDSLGHHHQQQQQNNLSPQPNSPHNIQHQQQPSKQNRLSWYSAEERRKLQQHQDFQRDSTSRRRSDSLSTVSNPPYQHPGSESLHQRSSSRPSSQKASNTLLKESFFNASNANNNNNNSSTYVLNNCDSKENMSGLNNITINITTTTTNNHVGNNNNGAPTNYCLPPPLSQLLKHECYSSSESNNNYNQYAHRYRMKPGKESLNLSELNGGEEIFEEYDSDYFEDERMILKWEARRAGLTYLGIEELAKHRESMKLSDEERMALLMR